MTRKITRRLAFWFYHSVLVLLSVLLLNSAILSEENARSPLSPWVTQNRRWCNPSTADGQNLCRALIINHDHHESYLKQNITWKNISDIVPDIWSLNFLGAFYYPNPRIRRPKTRFRPVTTGLSAILAFHPVGERGDYRKSA
jgi:hypothetical protein